MTDPRPDSALDALGHANDAVLEVLEAIDGGRVRTLDDVRARLDAVREETGAAYDRHLTLERRLALTTEAATLRQAEARIRDLSPAAAGRLLALAAEVEARLGHVPPHLIGPLERELGHRVGLRLTDADALRLYHAYRDGADLPESVLSHLETYECVRAAAERE